MTAEQAYAARHQQRLQQAERYARHDTQLAHARLIVFALGAALAIAWMAARAVPGVLVLLPAAVFVVLLILHEVVIARQRRARAAAAHWQRGLDRLHERWQGKGVGRSDFAAKTHPYASDVDLFGRASLFELLCTARTRIGEETLAQWLLAPAGAAEIKRRHATLRELTGRLDLSEDLALLGSTVQQTVHPDALRRWGEAEASFTDAGRQTLRLAALALSGAAIAAGMVLAWTSLGPWPLMGVLALQWLLARLTRERINAITASMAQPGVELETLALVLARLERESFTSDLGRELATTLGSGPAGAARAIRALLTRVSWLDAQRNQLFAPFAIVLLWNIQLGLAIEAWRREHGAQLRRWLEALGGLEALMALGTYAYEHPDDVLPTLVEGPARFAAHGLGHPLLPSATAVRNDVDLGPDAPLLLVSGSNMSGKSTLLRSVGINAVLALAGAPVRARSLTLTPLALGATLRIHDSIQEGRSRFYAEIERIRELVNLTQGRLPLLFLLDEILHGTNSHDRRIGGQAIVQALARAGAIGLVTTHDLSLADVVETIPGARNVHFADHLEGGELVFDYALKPGVVARSNALELMRRIGLPV